MASGAAPASATSASQIPAGPVRTSRRCTRAHSFKAPPTIHQVPSECQPRALADIVDRARGGIMTTRHIDTGLTRRTFLTTAAMLAGGLTLRAGARSPGDKL